MALSEKVMFAMLEKIKNEINDNTLTTIKQVISELNISSLLGEQNKRIEKLTEENDRLKLEVSRQRAVIDSMSREKNLIFYGMEEKEGESREQIMEKILDLSNSVMEVELKETDIDFVKRLGTAGPGTKRPIMLSLVSNMKRQSILNNGIRLKTRKLSVYPDCDKETREKKKKLYSTQKQLRDAGYDVKIKGIGLLINGNYATWNDLTEDALNKYLEEASLSAFSASHKSKRIAHQEQSPARSAATTGGNITQFLRPQRSKSKWKKPSERQ
ncbi:uncharacterized protein LOC120353767 [Nilaparvata lugens]|uniref:uncharacterized protein LOC120353767 n=1 Tax=Nilaparvata lugens TaxID=108931 RepID=UPI00193E45B4|nr:uncharacterized protein LOC120353767 [Nilaparvata lugens]